jgi:hypothetical protein
MQNRMTRVWGDDSESTQCPHCFQYSSDKTLVTMLAAEDDGKWGVRSFQCPGCRKFSFSLIWHSLRPKSLFFVEDTEDRDPNPSREWLVHPRSSGRPPCPPEVPVAVAQDYAEACLVIGDSPRASAALSRRCLQWVLRETLKVKGRNLYEEIETAVEAGKVRSDITSDLHSVREGGNLAAHPIQERDNGRDRSGCSG